MQEISPSVFVVLQSESEAVLPAIGVRPSILTAAAIAGEQARDRCTPNHPPAAAGFVAWMDCVRSLRDSLVGAPMGWVARNVNNYSTVESPDGLVAISAAGGDAWTGDPEFQPSTLRPKGMATRQIVQANQMSFALPGITPLRQRTTIQTTWILLVSRRLGRNGDVINVEISRPGSITDSGWIVTWETRFILPPIDYSGSPRPGRGRTDEDEGDDLDIPITRR